MKVKLYKRTNKDYDDIFTKDKYTKTIDIELKNQCRLYITEQQVGRDLLQPHIEIILNDRSYSMDWDYFVTGIKKI